jgi:hypothetical protein
MNDIPKSDNRLIVPDETGLLALKQIAQRLQTSVQAVKTLIATGHLEVWDLEGRVLVTLWSACAYAERSVAACTSNTSFPALAGTDKHDLSQLLADLEQGRILETDDLVTLQTGSPPITTAILRRGRVHLAVQQSSDSRSDTAPGHDPAAEALTVFVSEAAARAELRRQLRTAAIVGLEPQ